MDEKMKCLDYSFLLAFGVIHKNRIHLSDESIQNHNIIMTEEQIKLLKGRHYSKMKPSPGWSFPLVLPEPSEKNTTIENLKEKENSTTKITYAKKKKQDMLLKKEDNNNNEDMLLKKEDFCLSPQAVEKEKKEQKQRDDDIALCNNIALCNKAICNNIMHTPSFRNDDHENTEKNNHQQQYLKRNGDIQKNKDDYELSLSSLNHEKEEISKKESCIDCTYPNHPNHPNHPNTSFLDAPPSTAPSFVVSQINHISTDSSSSFQQTTQYSSYIQEPNDGKVSMNIKEQDENHLKTKQDDVNNIIHHSTRLHSPLVVNSNKNDLLQDKKNINDCMTVKKDKQQSYRDYKEYKHYKEYKDAFTQTLPMTGMFTKKIDNYVIDIPTDLKKKYLKEYVLPKKKNVYHS